MAEREPQITEWRLFGLSAAQAQERLADLSAGLSAYAPADAVRPLEDGVVAVCLPDEAAGEAADRLGAYIYSRQGQTLPQRVVELLTHHGKTVATAESCTGGLVAAGLTAVPGSSRVFGTGVVSYSWDCKQALLDVDKATLAAYGAVSAPVAQQMARGVRRRAGADLGVAVTGEAGPVAGEDKPVGTVFVALADARRTWVKELHLEEQADGREAIRRLAAAHVLDLLRRYLEACPAVMAGGILHRALDKQPSIPKAGSTGDRRWWLTLFPHRGDSLRHLLFKIGAWMLALTVLVCGTAVGLLYLKSPDDNRLLQDSLGDLYWGDTADLTGNAGEANGEDTSSYPPGMVSTFRGLYDRNPDVAGWLHIPNTVIDYPVMNYADGYYKNHSFDGQYSLYGQPYFHEEHLSAGELPRTITIHGKNTRDGQMFSSLLSYRRIAYLRENPVIELNTLYTAARYEVFAVLLVNTRAADAPDYAKTAFANDKAFESHLRALQARALFRSQRSVTAADKVLFLSTGAESEYGYTGARFVVAARLLAEEESTATYYANRITTLRSTTTTTRRVTTTTTVKSTATTATETTEDDKTTTSVTTTQSTTTMTTPSTEETTSTTEKNTEQTENQEDADIGN